MLISIFTRVLDLSFNNLKHVPSCLSHLTSLRTIYFVQNRISHIQNLSSLGKTLRSLELGGNRIRVCLQPSVRSRVEAHRVR
jgi:protein phosphatase 1 regulatory subunit 7